MISDLDSAHTLEQQLGDPQSPTALLSFRRVVEADESSAYPADAFPELRPLRIERHIVPKDLGGELTSFSSLSWLARSLARRDITTTFSYAMNTLLGAECVWTHGSDAQRKLLAADILNGDQVAFAFSEREHGADLLACDMRATRSDDGFLLSGEKWTIGNATRSRWLTVFARTNEEGGARGFSILLVDKRTLTQELRAAPKILTMGLRGADVSGVELRQARVPASNVVGDIGLGLEITVKSMQVSRALAPALSVGATDTILRSNVAWLRSRNLYGGKATDLPYVQYGIAATFAMHLFSEVTAIVAARGLHVLPEQMSTISAIAKYLCPTVANTVANEATNLLGARHYLREGHFSGITQKMVRDLPVANFGHGAAMINLQTIALQLRTLLTKRTHASGANLQMLFDLRSPPPAFDPTRLRMSSNAETILGCLATLSQEVEMIAGIATHICDGIRKRVERMNAELADLELQVRALTSGRHLEAAAYDVSALYARLYAGTAAVLAFIYARSGGAPWFLSGEWLCVALDLIVFNRSVSSAHHDPAMIASIYEAALECERANMLFSVQEFHL